MPPQEQFESVITHLEKIEKQLVRQNSFWHILAVGIIYGIGFFIGSAVIATIAFGLLGPWVGGHVQWINQAYTTGASLLKR